MVGSGGEGDVEHGDHEQRHPGRVGNLDEPESAELVERAGSGERDRGESRERCNDEVGRVIDPEHRHANNEVTNSATADSDDAAQDDDADVVHPLSASGKGS